MELGKITITGGNSTGECKYIQVFMMLICGNKQSMSISIDKKRQKKIKQTNDNTRKMIQIMLQMYFIQIKAQR